MARNRGSAAPCGRHRNSRFPAARPANYCRLRTADLSSINAERAGRRRHRLHGADKLQFIEDQSARTYATSGEADIAVDHRWHLGSKPQSRQHSRWQTGDDASDRSQQEIMQSLQAHDARQHTRCAYLGLRK